MEDLTDIEAKFALRHVSSCWLSMTKPVLRILDQWENLTEYFLKFLPKQSIFESKIKKTDCYKRIVDFLKQSTSKAGLCFISFIAKEFEEYLINMQANEPMIHTMYEKMSMLLYNLMKRFLTQSSLTENVEAR